MMRKCVSWMVLPMLFAASASLLSAQEPYANTSPPGKNPDVAAMPGVEDMYVRPTPGRPFTGKSVVKWTSWDGSTSHFAFLSMLARDSSGKLYFESRRRMTGSGDVQPRQYIIIIDPKEERRTLCYVSTKTCRINAFKRGVVYAESEDSVDAPRASTMETVSLGTSVLGAWTLDGRRETTFVAAGAYGNSDPLVITREIWHSPELDLDVVITKSDPRSGKFERKIDILSRDEPEPGYFAIPSDYTFVDNRPQVRAKQVIP